MVGYIGLASHRRRHPYRFAAAPATSFCALLDRQNRGNRSRL
jgi:hypothetical protein